MRNAAADQPLLLADSQRQEGRHLPGRSGTTYNLVPVDITAGEQFDEEYLRISPNHKMPAIVDPEGPEGESISVFESGAILIYLAEKSGKFWPTSSRERYVALQWLMFQMAHVGPMLGQAHHFRGYAPEKFPYAIDRYTNEAMRLYEVMDGRLSETDYFAGEYSIVDMAIYPWVASHERQGQRMEDYPSLRRWYEGVGLRPAVRRAMAVGEKLRRPIEDLDEEARDVLFGRKGRTRR
jgi:GSH-dependent disulfide-bond oxidoreductase